MSKLQLDREEKVIQTKCIFQASMSRYSSKTRLLTHAINNGNGTE